MLNLDYDNQTPFIYEQKKSQAQIQCPKSNVLCQSCTKNTAKYSCPKCKTPYCSLPCFKTHSVQCVEAFDLETEKDRYRGIKADFDTQRDTKKMLNKLYREFEDEPIQPYNLNKQVKRLENLLEQDQVDFEKLSLDEQKSFAEFITGQEEVQKYIIAWKPWWQVQKGSFSLYVDDHPIFVEDEEEKNDDQEKEYIQYRSELKDKIRTVIPFEKLTSKIQPHRDIQNHLCNITIGVALVSRLFNGDVWELNIEFKETLKQICTSFSTKTQIFESVCNAYRSVVDSVSNQDAQGIIQLLLVDAIEIFSNKFYVVETLFIAYDVVHSICKSHQNILEQQLAKKKCEAIEEVSEKKQIQKEIKDLDMMKNKLIYFLSLTLSKPHAFFISIKEDLQQVQRDDIKFQVEVDQIKEYKESKLIV